MALSKENRLRKKNDFDAVFKKGASFKNSCLALKVAKNGLSGARVGIVVSLKVSKKAVERNKIRRRLSEAVKANFPMEKGFDMALVALPPIKEKDFAGVDQCIKDIFKKAKLFDSNV